MFCVCSGHHSQNKRRPFSTLPITALHPSPPCLPCPSLHFADLLKALQTHNKQFLACSHSALLPQRTHYLNCHAALSSGRAASVRPSISPICLFSSPHTWHKSIPQHFRRAESSKPGGAVIAIANDFTNERKHSSLSAHHSNSVLFVTKRTAVALAVL